MGECIPRGGLCFLAFLYPTDIRINSGQDPISMVTYLGVELEGAAAASAAALARP